MMNGFSHCYHLGLSTFIYRRSRNNFNFLSHFPIKFLYANRIAPDGTPYSVASTSFWGYAVCVCPINRTSVFYESSTVRNNDMAVFSSPEPKAQR